MKNVGIIIQARNSSSRYPKKMLHDFGGKNSLELVIDRVKKSALAKKIVLATTDEPIDDILETIAVKNGVFVFRGKRENVLERYYKASKKYGLDVIVRITGDCPLIDYRVIDFAILEFLKRGVYYLLVSKIVDGFDVEVFSKKALKKALCETKDRYDLEHVTPFMKRFCKKKRFFVALTKDDYSDVHISLDFKDDAKNIEFVLNSLGNDFSYFDFLEFLKSDNMFLSKLKKG